MRKHVHNMGISIDDPICMLCYENEETAHFILEWEATVQCRHIDKENLGKRIVTTENDLVLLKRRIEMTD